jgi:hypothetical protein
MGRFNLNFTLDDEDWFSFRLSAPGGILAGTEGGLDTQMSLFGPGSSSAHLATNDDGGDEYNARITRYLGEPGVYYLRVTPYDNNSLGQYILVLEAVDIKAPVADSMEPNNSQAQAGTFNISRQPLDLNISPGDEDWFKLDLGSYRYRDGEVLSVYTSGETDTYIEVYQDGALIHENDDGGAEDYNARVTFSPGRGGNYYIKIRGYDDTVMGDYSLHTETQTVEMDQYEPNNTRTQATGISPGQTLSGNALADYDTADWFTFTITQPGVYTIGTTGGMDTILTLYGGGDEELDSDDDSGSNDNARIERNLERGTYYARVTLYDGGYGEYSFFVRRK